MLGHFTTSWRKDYFTKCFDLPFPVCMHAGSAMPEVWTFSCVSSTVGVNCSPSLQSLPPGTTRDQRDSCCVKNVSCFSSNMERCLLFLLVGPLLFSAVCAM